jgi:hypothetical protein
MTMGDAVPITGTMTSRIGPTSTTGIVLYRAPAGPRPPFSFDAPWRTVLNQNLVSFRIWAFVRRGRTDNCEFRDIGGGRARQPGGVEISALGGADHLLRQGLQLNQPAGYARPYRRPYPPPGLPSPGRSHAQPIGPAPTKRAGHKSPACFIYPVDVSICG